MLKVSGVSVTMCKLDVKLVIALLLLMAISAWADNSIKIELPSTGLLGCPPTTKRKMNIRIQSMKTSSGLIFNRKTLSKSLFGCFAPGQVLDAIDIKDCAEATEAAGLQMFQWIDGNCSGFKQGILKEMTCKTNDAVVLYSVQKVVIVALGKRYKRPSGKCLLFHDGGTGQHNFDRDDTLCQKNFKSSMFIEYQDGDFVEYMNDLNALKNVLSPPSLDHFVGMRRPYGVWTWQSSVVQENDPAVWVSYPDTETCAISSSKDGFKLTGSPCYGVTLSNACLDIP